MRCPLQARHTRARTHRFMSSQTATTGSTRAATGIARLRVSAPWTSPTSRNSYAACSNALDQARTVKPLRRKSQGLFYSQLVKIDMRYSRGLSASNRLIRDKGAQNVRRGESAKENAPNVPADDPQRSAAKSGSENGRHIGIVGDTYTILISGKDTAGSFCLIDMFV